MSQIERKWISDGAINGAKIDSGDSYEVYRLDATASLSVNMGGMAPQSQVHIRGSAAPATLRLESDGGVGRPWVLDSDTAGRFNVSDSSAGLTRLTVDGTGRVGIGTTLPQAELQVVGPSLDSRLALGSTSQYVINSFGGVPSNLVISKTGGSGSFAIDSTGHIVQAGPVAGSSTIGGDATVTGGLEVIGTTTIVNVQGITSDKLTINHATSDEAILINNSGSGPSISVNNTSSGYALITNQGNVGLGTTVPGYSLHVYGSTNGPVAEVLQNASAGTGAQTALAVRNNSAHDGGITSFSTGYSGSLFGGMPNADMAMFSSNHTGGMLIDEVNPSPMYFATNNSVRMVITATGSVGIGTTNPQTALAVSGSTSASSRVYSVDSLSVPISVGQPVKAVFMGMSGSYGEMNAYDYGANAALPLALQRSGGNVGIGSTQPAYLLDVNGTERVSGFLNVTTGAGSPGSQGTAGISALVYGNPLPILRVADVNRAVDVGLNGASHGYFEAKGGNDLLFLTSTAERVRINASGNVGVGTTNPGYKLSVQGSGTTVMEIRDFSGAGGSGFVGINQNSGTPQMFLGGTTAAGSAEVIDISTSKVGFGTTSPASTVHVQGTFQLGTSGVAVSNISSATNLGGGSPSNSNLSTQLAIKTYVDTQVAGSSPFTRTAPNIYPVILTDNVGIGTTNPTQRLDVYNAGATAVRAKSSAAGSTVQFYAENDAGRVIEMVLRGSTAPSNSYSPVAAVSGNATEIITNAEGPMFIGTNPVSFPQPIYFVGNGQTRMTLLGNGNVGVGTTTPSFPLHVMGGYLTIDGNTSSDPILYFRQSSGLSRIQYSNNLQFQDVSANPRMTITSGGLVGIGSTNPIGILDVYGSGAGINLTANGSIIQITGQVSPIFITDDFAPITVRSGSNNSVIVQNSDVEINTTTSPISIVANAPGSAGNVTVASVGTAGGTVQLYSSGSTAGGAINVYSQGSSASGPVNVYSNGSGGLVALSANGLHGVVNITGGNGAGSGVNIVSDSGGTGITVQGNNGATVNVKSTGSNGGVILESTGTHGHVDINAGNFGVNVNTNANITLNPSGGTTYAYGLYAGSGFGANFVTNNNSDYTCSSTDTWVLAGGGNPSSTYVVALPLAGSVLPGHMVGVKRSNSGGSAIKIGPQPGDTLDNGAATITLGGYGARIMVSDGVSHWWNLAAV